MPSLIDLRRRVRAVKNTQQITKAMKMVAASKLRRAQERILQGRPYAVGLQHMLEGLASRVDPSLHPLLATVPQNENAPILVIVVTGDKGLCGSFNTNVIKAAVGYVTESPAKCTLALVGRKGREFFTRRGFPVTAEWSGIFQSLKPDDAREIARLAMDAFTPGDISKVMLVYNEFKSVLSQRTVVQQLLPIPREDVASAGAPQADYIFEPPPQEIFNRLLPWHVAVQVYRALLESNAAFYAAQMTAMDTATKNSAEMIDSLTLYMNKVRQAAITREIIEVVSGAEAL
jgi:F-type H+-transporting ATPase subunit gamma